MIDAKVKITLLESAPRPSDIINLFGKEEMAVSLFRNEVTGYSFAKPDDYLSGLIEKIRQIGGYSACEVSFTLLCRHCNKVYSGLPHGICHHCYKEQ